MLKSCGTVDKVDQEECEEEGSGTVENVENKAEESFVGTSPISAHNSVSYNPPKNGLIASALEIPNSVCLSFEHVDPMLQSNSPPCSIKNTIPQDEKHSGLFTNIKNDLSTDHGLEFNKSENQEQCDKLMDLPNGPKQYNEVLIDGFAILSFKTMDDMLEFTKLDESQNPGMNPTIEQTYKRARRCGMPKLKRTKAFLKQTLSQTSTSNDLLRHRRHHHHHHNHSHYHFNNIHQHPSLCAYKSHCDTNHMSSTIHLSPNHEKDTKSIVNTTITDGINKLSSIQPNNTSNGNSNKHYHHRSYEVNNGTSLHEETNHNDVHYRDDETPTPPLHHHNPYCFTLNLSTHTIATSNSPIDNTLISSNRSHHHSHNHSSLTTMPKKEHRYSQESIQSPPEYTSMISPKNHSIGNNITSSSSPPPPQDYRSMSVPGIWSSRTKPDIISPQKTDKITYGNSCDTDGAKIMPKISVPSENLKRSDSINSSKSHCHQFSVAALTDEVMHSSAQSEESKSQPTIISKSPKHPSGKKRTYRKSEQRDIVNTVSDKYSHRRNEYDKSFAYSKFDNSTRVNRCTGVDNNGSNKSWNSAINDSLKGALYFPTTVGTNHNCERIHETVSKYSPMTNHNFNSTPFSLRNPADSLPAHSYLPPRGLQEPTSCGSQIRPLSSSSAHLAPPSVPSSICSNSFFSHQNLLKQFMGIDSETANQLLNDPRFMELYALTMATLSNNVDGVPDSILPPPVSRISLPNHANTIISTSVNSGNQNNNSCSRFKNGNTVGHLRTTDPSQFGETSLSHCGQQVNLSSIQNKLYPYNNMMMLGANRPPLAPSTVPQSSQTTSSSSINRLIPPNAESLSISQLQTDRSQAVLAAAYADREFVTSNSTLGKLKLSSQGIMINNGSDRNNNSTVPSSLVSSLQSTTNINCLSDSYNRNAQHFNMPPNPIIQRHHHLSSMPQSSIGTLESSTLHNSKSNSISSNLSCSLSSDSMLNKNFGSFPFKLFNGDLHNPVSSSSSSSLSTHNDRNTMMGLHKPEYMPSESVLRPNFPPPLQLIPPPLPPNIPPEFLKSFLVPDSSSSLFPGPKVNVTLNSSFLPSNPNLQSTQPLYSPMRVNHPNRSDKTNYNGILHRPVHGDKLYGRWADAHVRIALFIQHCKSSTQGLQSSPVISSIFSTSRLPIRPMVKRLSLGVHSSMPSSMTSGPVNYNSSKINIESVNNNRSTQPPPLRPPSLLPSQLHNPINSVNSNNNNNNNNNNSGPSIPSSITSDISFWGHLFNEFMNNLSKEFLNSISDCKDTQLATLQNFYSQMSQMNNSVLNGGSFPKSTDFSFLNSTVSSSSMANNSNNNNCSPVPSASNIAGFNFPLVTQSFNSLSSSSCSSSSSATTTTTSVRPTVLPSSPALMNFSSSTNVFNNNDLKRRRTDSSSSMDINNLPFPMRFPNSFPRPPTIHNYVPHQHSSLHSGSSIPPPPAHSDMINVAAAASLLNGFRLPETFLNHFPHPIQLSSVSSGSSLNDRKNTRSSNTTTGTITTSSNSSHLIPINPW